MSVSQKGGPRSKKEILLFSGGLDSLCAWFVLGKPPVLTFYLPTPYGVKEFQAAKVLARMLNMEHRTDIFFENSGWQEPNTTSLAWLFPLVARAAKSGYNKVELAVREGEGFLETMGESVSRLVGAHIEIASPFLQLGQGEMVAEALAQGATPQHLLYSSSCLSGGPGHCGGCQKCVGKALAFLQNGIEWPEGYFKTPIKSIGADC